MITGSKNQITYEIQYTKAAEKFFKEHKDVHKKYIAAIRELIIGDHPEKVDVKRIRGTHGVYYRIRLGDYRVVYTIINGKIIVITTLLAGARGDVYKKDSVIK